MRTTDRIVVVISLTLAVVIALFLLLPVLARADDLPPLTGVQEDGTGFVLLSSPCAEPIPLATTPEDRHPGMKAAIIVYPNGVREGGCWYPHPDRVDRVVVVCEHGQGGYVERKIFGPSV